MTVLDESRLRRLNVFLSLALVLALLSIAVYWWWFETRLDSELSTQTETWGQFGDYFGGVVGTLLVAATLAALLVSIRIQHAIHETTKRELDTTTRLLSEQGKAIRQQVFDATLFQMLNRFSAAVSSVHATQRETLDVRSGAGAFEVIYEHFRDHFSWQPGDDIVDSITQAHRQVYPVFETALGPYFRLLYHVFKRIDQEESLSTQERINYSNIARAQLSRYELVLLFYNGLTPYGRKFKPLIEKYGVLKHVVDFDLINLSHKSDPRLYSPTAFMSQEERDLFISESEAATDHNDRE